MAIVKIVKNNSGAERTVLNTVLADGESYQLEYGFWFEALDNQIFLDDVASGDVVVNDGTSDLNPADGLFHLELFDVGLPFQDQVNYQYAESESSSSTSSTSYQQKLRLTTNTLVAGDYRIGWSFEYAVSSNTKKAGFRVQVDDSTTIHEIDPEIRANDYESSSGFKKIALTAGVHTIDIDYKKISTNALIRNARLEIWRIN